MWFFLTFASILFPPSPPSMLLFRDLCLLLPSSERPRRRSDVTCATRKWTRRSTASSQREVGSAAPARPPHPGTAAAAPGVATQSNAADSQRSRVQGMGRGVTGSRARGFAATPSLLPPRRPRGSGWLLTHGSAPGCGGCWAVPRVSQGDAQLTWEFGGG